jgi:hypothetical protein
MKPIFGSTIGVTGKVKFFKKNEKHLDRVSCEASTTRTKGEPIMTDGICDFAEQVGGVTTFQPHNVDRVGFCDHTAGGFYSTLRSSAFWNGAGVSVHFAISRKGEICQIVNIFDTAFAQGRLGPSVTWGPYATMNQQNPNLYLISTEHEDAESVNGQTQFIPGSEWTKEQYTADLKVKAWCVAEVKRVMNVDLLRFGADSLAGHHMFDGNNRAECPGRFWRDSYRSRLLSDLTNVMQPATRTWLYGNEQGGEEVVGKQIWRWHLGVTTDKYGDEAGLFPGRHFHNQGGAFVQVAP